MSQELQITQASGCIADVKTASEETLKLLGYTVMKTAIDRMPDDYVAITAVDTINSGCGWDKWLNHVVDGMVGACLEANVSIVGGEMAAMRNIMRGNSIDLIIMVIGSRLTTH